METTELNKQVNFLKGYVIAEVPIGFGAMIAPSFRHGLNDAELEAAIIAFRKLLANMFDKIIKGDEKLFVKKKNMMTLDLNTIAWVLYRMGEMCELKVSPHKRLTGKIVEGYHYENKPHFQRLYQFLAELGFRFTGVDFSKEIPFHEAPSFNIEHDDEATIVGLKLIAESLDNVKGSIRPLNIILRGDFYPLANSKPMAHTWYLRDFVRSLSPEISAFLLEMDAYLINNGCKVVGKKNNFTTDVSFEYSAKKGRSKVGIAKISISVDECVIMLDDDVYSLDKMLTFDWLKQRIETKLMATTGLEVDDGDITDTD